MKRLAVVAVLAVVAAACGGATAGTQATEAPSTAPPVSTEPAAPGPDPTPATTEAAPGATEAAPGTTEAPAGPLAPDFSLTLSDGSVFTLSTELKPVYLIFWAEW